MPTTLQPARPWVPIAGKEDARSLFLATRRFCARKGIPVHDPEYGSAIGWAVAKAIATHDPRRGAKLINFCIFLALRECGSVRHSLARWHQGHAELDEVDPFWHLWDSRLAPPPLEPTPLDRADFELLSFVAAHGRMKAAKLLGIDIHTLRGMLADTVDRLRSARD